jgi:hypothetical protein
MTVRELISLNQMITDVEITVRKDGNALLDQLNFGPSEGVKPPHPMMVPIDERYINNFDMAHHREAYYIPESINAWDDGKDYWQVKPERLPAKWLDLEVYGWNVWPASQVCTTSPRRGHNVNFHGERINIIALPSGSSLAVKKEVKEEEQTEDMQMSLADCGY